MQNYGSVASNVFVLVYKKKPFVLNIVETVSLVLFVITNWIMCWVIFVLNYTDSTLFVRFFFFTSDPNEPIPIFLANPPVIFFPEYEIGQIYEVI